MTTQVQVLVVNGVRTIREQTPDVALSALVRQAQCGDLGAFEQLVRESQSAITSVVARIIDGQDDIDDVVQDVYVQAFEHLRSFRRESRFSTWLHRIAVNTSLKRLNQIQRKRGVSLDDPDNGLAERLESSPSDDPGSIVLQKERDEAVRQAVSALSEKHRVVVILRYFEDYSCQDIAEILGCSIGTVWSRLHYGCRQLRGMLEWVLE